MRLVSPEKIGKIDEKLMEKVNDALVISFGLIEV